MPIDQTNRFIGLKVTGLDPNALGLRSFAVQEQLSSPFQIDVELSSEDPKIDFDKVLNKEATIRLDMPKEKIDKSAPDKRFYHGVINRLVQVGDQDQKAHYSATIVPKLWLLTRRSNCRIFPLQGDKQSQAQPQTPQQTVLDVIKAVLDEQGILFDSQQLDTSKYPKKEIWVQYRETDFDFISRLMEEEGIFYFFRHEEGKHTMVLVDADGSAALKEFPGYKEVKFQEATQAGTVGERVVDWVVQREIQSDSYCLKDFDFQKANRKMHPLIAPANERNDVLTQLFDYPGRYLQQSDGDRLADLRLKMVQAQREIFFGQSNARGLAAGCTFSLKGHPRAQDCLITSASLQADAGEFGSAESGQPAPDFSCSITAIPKSQAFCPPCTTDRPVVDGPQTAIVAGDPNEEIDTDKYGRVKVQFHWDRYGKSDKNASCWVRVSQVWAGKNWGAIHIPRIGQEVIVEFLEGDPDRPIITGRVYNSEQMPPYDLPASKTQSGIKSRSSKGGSTANFNEIRFEDKKGSEQLYVHAEKNQDNIVENDETTSVGHDRTETVGNDEKITIGNNRTEKVGVNEDITIGANRTEKVGVNETISIGSNRSETVGANETISIAITRTRNVGVNDMINVGAAQEITVGAAQAITVGAAQAITVGAAQAITVGADQATTVGANQVNTIAKNRTSSVGKDDSLSVGKKLAITAGDEILIKTGDASILMKKDGTIQIKGKNITIKGSGKIGIKADGDVVIKGSKVAAN